MYLHHIMTRREEALIRRVLMAQTSQLAKGDWCNVVKEDMDSIGLDISFEEVGGMSKNQLKTLVNNQVANAAFEYLNSGACKMR